MRFETYNVEKLHIGYMFWTHFVASEANTASKQPQRSDLTTDLESLVQTSYSTMFVWTV